MLTHSLNRVELIGRIGADPEVHYPQTELLVCMFWLITEDFWRDHEGNAHDAVEWHRIVAWGQLGEQCNQYLVQGVLVYIEGHLTTREWQDDSGQMHHITETAADNLLILNDPMIQGQPQEKPYIPINDIRTNELYIPPSVPDPVTRRNISV